MYIYICMIYVSLYMSPSLYYRIHRTCRLGRVVFSVPHDDLQCVLCYVPLLGYLTAPQDPGACAKAHKQYNGNWLAERILFNHFLKIMTHMTPTNVIQKKTCKSDTN